MPLGPRRVQAWIHGVINPVLRHIEHSVDLLKRKSWTWRMHRGELQWIRPAEDYFDPEELPNLEDFATNNADAKRALDAWKAGIKTLVECAKAEYDYIIAFPRFKEAFESCRRELRPEDLRAGWPDERGFYTAAEHIVNNRDTLDEDDPTRTFWQKYGEQMRAPLSRDAAWKRRHAATREAGEKLLNAGQRLVTALRKLRQNLSEQYDIPFAPTASE